MESEEEMKTCATYVQQCAPQIYGVKKHYYYYCNRSGKYRSKAHGISKIGEQIRRQLQTLTQVKWLYVTAAPTTIMKYSTDHAKLIREFLTLASD